VQKSSPRSWVRKHFDTCFIVLQVWLDGLAILASVFLGFWLLKAIDADLVGAQGAWSKMVVWVTGVTLTCFWVFGMYRWRKSILNVEEYRAAFKAIATSFLISSSSIYFLRTAQSDQLRQNVQDSPLLKFLLVDVIQPLHDVIALGEDPEGKSRILFVVVFVVMFAVTCLQRGIMFAVSSALHARGFGNTNVALYGTGPLALRVQQKLRLFPTLGYHFVGFLDDDEDLHGRSLRGHPVLGGRDQLDRLVREHEIRKVIVADPGLEEDDLLELVGILDTLGIEYQVVPRLYHFFSQRFTVDNLDSIPLITVGDRSRPVYHAVKRGIDIVVSAGLLILLSPLMALIALLIKRSSPGPVLFSQVRVGQRGRTFRIFKFRTMYVDMCGDEETPQASSDPRITRIGRFLRKTSLDELPQLINVLRGDMSLVGPRPEMPFIVDTYSPVDRLRLDAKPGITGLWQVSEARKAPIHENVDYDLYYIENQSVFLDTVILLMTAFSIFRLRTTH